mmetsp:Transcript_14790/g.50415  ORF Transcript_14790/g.50415 Transcript_14790/m.50415 type:complete len:203 (-) Transcript_14790:1735-2343(-)
MTCWRWKSAKLFWTQRLIDSTPSWKSPPTVLLPVLVRSPLRAAVPEYCTEMKSPWSAHSALNCLLICSAQGKGSFVSVATAARHASLSSMLIAPIAASCFMAMWKDKTLCATFVRSRQSTQLTRMTPPCCLSSRKPPSLTLSKQNPWDSSCDEHSLTSSGRFLKANFPQMLWKSKGMKTMSPSSSFFASCTILSYANPNGRS